MLDSKDIQKLTELLATKEDFRGVEKRLDGIDTRLDAMDTRLMNVESSFIAMSRIVESLDDRMTVLEEKQDKVIAILDKMVGRMEALNQEYLILKERDTRYERWFHQIAEKVGISLIP